MKQKSIIHQKQETAKSSQLKLEKQKSTIQQKKETAKSSQLKFEKRKSTIQQKKETAKSSQLKIEKQKSTIKSTEESQRKKTRIKDENDDKPAMKEKQDQELVDTIKTKMVGLFNINFHDKLRQLFTDHALERTSAIDQIISDYQNQSATLEKELISKCDELRRRHIVALVNLNDELSQVVSGLTGAESMKKEYMEYDLKQEPL